MKRSLLPLLLALAIPAAARAADPTYNGQVSAIFQAKCAACHGGFLPQGGLKLNSLKNTLKGGKNGKAVIPGNADDSLMVKQFYLPLTEKTHMPPKDVPQLTDAEIAVIKAWIDGGAK